MADKKIGCHGDDMFSASHSFPPRPDTPDPEEDTEDAPALGQPAAQPDKTLPQGRS